ncbi:MAG: homoserine kinase [Candidatus Bathyarchaeia archaeon]
MKACVEAVAPATSANLGAGFDVFGVALDVLFDSVYVELIEEKKIEITVEGKGANTIPTEPDRNTAGIVAQELLKTSEKKYGLKMKVKKGIRPGSGLGSSAASAAATAVAVNELLQLGLPKKELINYAALGEKASAGVPHADNVSAAILGNFTVIVSREPLEVVSLPLPENVEFAIAFPYFACDTSLARSVLPKKINLSDMVHNVGCAASFIAGITLNDVDLMGKGMEDVVIEPARASLIPGLYHVKEKAVETGASGVAISGAGPSVLALINTKKTETKKVAMAMCEAFRKYGVESEPLCAKPGAGAKVVYNRQ